MIFLGLHILTANVRGVTPNLSENDKILVHKINEKIKKSL